jgi:ATP-dependent Clp protease protease subunit
VRASIGTAAVLAAGLGLAIGAFASKPLPQSIATPAAEAAAETVSGDPIVALPTSAVPAAPAPSLITPPADSPLPSALLVLGSDEDAAYLRLDGIITPEVADRFELVLDSLPAGRRLVLELNSPGGYTGAGYAMIDRLQEERGHGRAIDTRVNAGDACESMCFGLFMAGDRRYAAPAAEFMVHAPRSLTAGTVTLRSTGRMIERIKSLGADAAWLERITAAGAFSGQQDHRETAAQLAAENANVVTDLLP